MRVQSTKQRGANVREEATAQIGSNGANAQRSTTHRRPSHDRPACEVSERGRPPGRTSNERRHDVGREVQQPNRAVEDAVLEHALHRLDSKWRWLVLNDAFLWRTAHGACSGSAGSKARPTRTPPPDLEPASDCVDRSASNARISCLREHVSIVGEGQPQTRCADAPVGIAE